MMKPINELKAELEKEVSNGFHKGRFFASMEIMGRDETLEPKDLTKKYLGLRVKLSGDPKEEIYDIKGVGMLYSTPNRIGLLLEKVYNIVS